MNDKVTDYLDRVESKWPEFAHLITFVRDVQALVDDARGTPLAPGTTATVPAIKLERALDRLAEGQP